jgi:hypothetical protein
LTRMRKMKRNTMKRKIVKMTRRLKPRVRRKKRRKRRQLQVN